MASEEAKKGSEVKLDAAAPKGRGAWADALKELEDYEQQLRTPRPTGPPKAAPPPPPPAEEGPEKLFNEAIKPCQEAIDAIEKFVKAHPYLIAPNIYRMCQDHIKETMVVLSRERDRALRDRQPAGGDEA